MVSAVGIDPGEVVGRHRGPRVDRERAFVLLARLVEFVLQLQDDADERRRDDRSRLVARDGLILGFGLVEPVLKDKQSPETEVRVERVGSKRERAPEGGFREDGIADTHVALAGQAEQRGIIRPRL